MQETGSVGGSGVWAKCGLWDLKHLGLDPGSSPGELGEGRFGLRASVFIALRWDDAQGYHAV